MKGFIKSILFAGTAVLLVSCNPVEQQLKVKVDTKGVNEYDQTSCVVEGEIIDAGEGKIEQHGFCYSVNADPDIFQSNTQLGQRTATGAFTDTLSGLTNATTYYVRAYAQSSSEIFYGEVVSFTTLTAEAPTVLIDSVGEYENDTALVTGHVADDGGSEILECGICWSLDENPDTGGDHASHDAGSGHFEVYITGLLPDTTYYLRSYAINEVATGYSEQSQIITPEGGISIATAEITGITKNSAISGGNIKDDGGLEVTSRGICWNETGTPTIQDLKTEDGNGSGIYTSSISGLTASTTYYVRAYAVNASGTYYGNELSFTTAGSSASLPVVTTGEITGVTSNSAQGGGTITDDGGSSITARGVCWSTAHAPDLGDEFTEDGPGTGSFTSNLQGLSPNTTYYVRAYATNSEGTAYGPEVSFTTAQVLFIPTLTTVPVTGITPTSAVSGGNITDDGGASVTARGVCWSTETDPDLTGDHTTDESGIGMYVSQLSGLTPDTDYYVRAYATNEVGTAYGPQLNFKSTREVSLPAIQTLNVTAVTDTSAESGGTITDDGGSPILARGVCWSTSHTPDLNDSFTDDGTGTGSFVSTLSGLDPNTTYYVRAYATNSTGTAFGNELTFITNSIPVLPQITTSAVSNIASNSAKSGGTISSDGGSTVTARGVCWSEDPNPELTDNYTSDGGGLGSFVSTLTGLQADTRYYVRAYATNDAGTAYGNEVDFITLAMGESVTDIDGNVYQTVVIGTQTWMAENLKTTHYSNGDPITQLADVLDWVATDAGAYCYYDNDISNRDPYGALYNFYAVTDNRNVCPAGWHVPSDEEWTTLEEYAGGADVAGAKLRPDGGDLWPAYSYGTNEFGFNALPGGGREHDGAFRMLGNDAEFWSSDENVGYGISIGMTATNYKTTHHSSSKNYGYSVRCIKD